MILSEDQQALANNALEFIKAPKKNGAFLISGYAGTGKTTVLGHILSELLYPSKTLEDLNSSDLFGFSASSTKYNVACVAPTHKAVKVMKNNYSKKVVDKIEFSTIHKLLRVKQVINHINGKVTYEPEYNSTDNPISAYNVIIVDESSMLDSTLYETLMSQRLENQAVIFVGDVAQIPPVGSLYSPVFDADIQLKDNIYVNTLTKVHRQAADSPIISLATHIRENIKAPIRVSALPSFQMVVANTGVKLLNENAEVMEVLTQLFKSPQFQENADWAKVVAWTNKEVNRYNNIIRTKILGYKDQIVIGEKLLLDLLFEDKDMKFSTNTELTVVQIDKGLFQVESKILDEDEQVYEIYNILADTDEYGEIKLPVLTTESQKKFDSNLKKIKNFAMQLEPHERKSVWKEFYSLMGSFAHVKYNYAITGHKSQGSTYNNTCVVFQDICSNPDIYERNRILYVAITRSSEMLYFC